MFKDAVPFFPDVADKRIQEISRKLGLKTYGIENFPNRDIGISFTGIDSLSGEVIEYILYFRVDISRIGDFLFIPIALPITLKENDKFDLIIPQSSLSVNDNNFRIKEQKRYNVIPIHTTETDESSGFIQRTIFPDYFPGVTQEIEMILSIRPDLGGFYEMFEFQTK